SYTFGEYVIPRIIANLLDLYPEIQPTVTIGNTARIAELVAKHQLDIGIVEGHFSDRELIEEPFAEDMMVVVASPDHHLARQVEEVKIGRASCRERVGRKGGVVALEDDRV